MKKLMKGISDLMDLFFIIAIYFFVFILCWPLLLVVAPRDNRQSRYYFFYMIPGFIVWLGWSIMSLVIWGLPEWFTNLIQ